MSENVEHTDGVVSEPTAGVRVVGIDLPFFDLMWIMVKVALAAVPAAFIVVAAYGVAMTLLAGVGGL